MYLEMTFGKIKSKLWGSCSSNLTRIQPNRREFVFFTRGGSKLFTPNHFFQLCIKYVLVFYKIDLVQFCNKYIIGPSQKNSFWALENMENEFFVQKNLKTSLGNIVWNSKMHPCSRYEVIWTNYAMNVAIRLIIWLESHESSCIIARFWELCFKIIAVLQVYKFSW